jgi:hypothetical protein
MEDGALWQVVWVSLVAGVGISALFSLAIVGSARAADARRSGRGRAAAGWAGLTALALLLFAAGVALGVEAMVSK